MILVVLRLTRASSLLPHVHVSPAGVDEMEDNVEFVRGMREHVNGAISEAVRHNLEQERRMQSLIQHSQVHRDKFRSKDCENKFGAKLGIGYLRRAQS